jgi:N-acetylmuramoyl-L-alanine amidase
MVHAFCRVGVVSLVMALIIVLTTYFALAAGTSTMNQKAEQAYRLAKKEYGQFNRDRKQWPKRKNWIRLINRFTRLHQTYPDSQRADDFLYLAAGLYASLYNYSGWNADLQRSNDLYGKIVADYHGSRLADDSLYHMGLNAIKMDRREQARAYFRQVIQDFPKGDMAGKAKARLILAPPPEKAPSSCAKTGGTGVYRPDAPRGKGSLKGKARVDNIRYWSSPTYTRVVIDLDHEVSYTRGILKDKHLELNEVHRFPTHNYKNGTEFHWDINNISTDGILCSSNKKHPTS